jgi:carnitine-CoA ligase
MNRMIGVPDLLARLALHDPDRVLLIQAESGHRETAGALWAAAQQRAARLGELGVDRGDRVATITANTVESVRLWAAICLLGAVEVPVGAELRGDGLAHVLTGSGASVLVVDELGSGRVATESVPASITTLVVAGGVRPAVTAHVVDLVDGIDRPLPVPVTEPVRADDIALVLFTSGTTGPAKGVLVTWGQILSTSEGTFPAGTAGPDTVVYSAFPANHISARVLVHIPLVFGGTTVLRERFSASRFWPDVDRYGCTTVAFAMTMANILLQAAPQPDDADHPLRDVMIAPLIPDWPHFADRFGVRVCTLFTMTEVSTPLVSGWGPEVWTSCGRPRTGWPHYQLRLVDEAGSDVPVGEIGELTCRTEDPAGLNAGYLDRPEETERAWRDGWFHTGDLFRRDKQDRYHFAGRLKDAIRHRGENVSAYEVERAATTLDGVRAAAAVGVPSAWSEEDIYLYLVPQDGASVDPDVVRDQLAARVARYMVPSYVEVVDDLPYTPSGKVHKAVLRQRAGDAARPGAGAR